MTKAIRAGHINEKRGRYDDVPFRESTDTLPRCHRLLGRAAMNRRPEIASDERKQNWDINQRAKSSLRTPPSIRQPDAP
jgi:hypothetical protein